MQAKLDELIRSIEGVHNALLDLEELDEGEIAHVRRDYHKLAAEARESIKKGKPNIDCREIRQSNMEQHDTKEWKQDAAIRNPRCHT